MGLPIAAGCDTAWIQNRVSVVMRLALRCGALDRYATLEPWFESIHVTLLMEFLDSVAVFVYRQLINKVQT